MLRYDILLSAELIVEQSRCLSAMSYLGFVGKETRVFTRLMQVRNRFGVPWIAVCISALPGTFAFMTADITDPNTSLQSVSAV